MSFVGIGYAEVTMKFRAATLNRDATCVFGINISGAGTSDPLTIATAIDAMLVGASSLLLPSNYSSTWFYRGLRVAVGADGGPVIYDLAKNVQGTLVADPVPPNVSVLVQKRSIMGGRRNRGRLYLPPFSFSESSIDSVGAITGAAVTALQTKVSKLRTDLVAADMDMVILHSTSEIQPTMVSSLVVESVVATQRRRLRR